MKTLLTPTPLIACEEKYLNMVLDELPDGNYSVIGSVDKGVIDFDCSSLVESWNITGVCKAYKNYKGFVEFHTDSQKSFKSLLYSHSLSLDKKYLIIKPI